MTNKPMLSVDLRAFLEGVVKLCAVHGPTYNELRALLDKEVNFLTPDCPDCACVQDGHCLCIPSKPAALHQGEPIKLSDDVREFLQEWLDSSTGGEDEDIDYDFANQLGLLLGPIYAEPPAPVAVVMPEKKSVPEIEDYNTNIDEVAFAEGYNDALDDVARLNGLKT